jgi:hypothetical protein
MRNTPGFPRLRPHPRIRRSGQRASDPQGKTEPTGGNMPIVAVLHFAVAVFFAVHSVRTGRDRYWLMVLFAFPLLGSLVYFFAEYMRDMHNTRGGRKALRLMQGIIDPERALRHAQIEFDRTPTAFNEAQLARALLAKGRTEDAIRHYRNCCAGPYAKDASFLKGLAIAQLEAGQFTEACNTLHTLFEAHPQARRDDLALMEAEALSKAGDARADAAFESVVRENGSIEARCKYGLHLWSAGRTEVARSAFGEVLRDAQRGNRHSRDLNREWITQARDALRELDQA